MWTVDKKIISECNCSWPGTKHTWICETCGVVRDLEPYDKPETTADKKLHAQLFGDTY